jgi:hypothetical protein
MRAIALPDVGQELNCEFWRLRRDFLSHNAGQAAPNHGAWQRRRLTGRQEPLFVSVGCTESFSSSLLSSLGCQCHSSTEDGLADQKAGGLVACVKAEPGTVATSSVTAKGRSVFAAMKGRQPGSDLIFGAVPYDCRLLGEEGGEFGASAQTARLVAPPWWKPGQDPVKRLSWQSMNCCSILRCMRAVFPRPPRCLDFSADHPGPQTLHTDRSLQ